MNSTNGSSLIDLTKLNKDTRNLTIFYIANRFFFGGIITTVFILAFKVVSNSFDQSVRYRKRYHSSMYLNYLYKIHKIKDEVSLTEIMDAYKIWTSSIDSAFSKNKKFKELEKEIPNTKVKNIIDRVDPNKMSHIDATYQAEK